METLHLIVGVGVLVANLAAGAVGAVAWLRRRPSVAFWYLLRVGQATVVLQVLLGALLALAGHESPDDLHYVYGALPLLVSLLAEAARAGGLDLLGYTSQAQFLINCGIIDLLRSIDHPGTAEYARAASHANQLLSPAEMGELFKAIAFGRGVAPPLVGFRSGNRSAALVP